LHCHLFLKISDKVIQISSLANPVIANTASPNRSLIGLTLKNKSIKLTTEADENTTGPTGFTFTDLDGNIILIDQHR
jgi:hypothetical protein